MSEKFHPENLILDLRNKDKNVDLFPEKEVFEEINNADEKIGNLLGRIKEEIKDLEKDDIELINENKTDSNIESKEIKVSQEQKIEKIKNVLDKNSENNRKEASSLGDKVLSVMIKTGEVYQKIPRKYRRMFWTGVVLGSVVWRVLGVLDNDSDEHVQTIAHSISSSLDSVDVSNLDTNTLVDSHTSNFFVEHVSNGFPESLDVQHNHLVFTAGDEAGHIWGGIEKILDNNGLLDGYDDSQRIQTIDTIKDNLATWSSEDLKNIGISSGDISLVGAGEEVDLSSVIEANENILSHSIDKVVPLTDVEMDMNVTPTLVVDNTLINESSSAVESSLVEDVSLQPDMDTKTANSTPPVIDEGVTNKISQQVDLSYEDSNSEVVISTHNEAVPEHVFEKFHIDQENAQLFFSNVELPEFFKDHIQLFEGNDYLKNWVDSNSGVASYEINDFCSIDPETLSDGIGINSRGFVKNTQELIKSFEYLGHKIPSVDKSQTVFDYLQRALGPFVKL